MAPQVTSLDDLAFLHEECDAETGNCHTTFAHFDKDGTAYFGTLDLPKHQIKLEQFPSPGVELTKAPDSFPANIYIKRPSVILYDVFKEHGVLDLIPKDLLEEARAMEMLTKHPHPHIVRYHGCHVRRGRIVGLVLDRHSNTLSDYLKKEIGSLDKSKFMQALKSAIDHLHSINWAHNDLHPNNILVDDVGMPVLIDFGSARQIGARLGTSRGTKGWIEGEMKDYHTSDSGHDLFALEKIQTWMESPTFDD